MILIYSTVVAFNVATWSLTLKSLSYPCGVVKSYGRKHVFTSKMHFGKKIK